MKDFSLSWPISGKTVGLPKCVDMVASELRPGHPLSISLVSISRRLRFAFSCIRSCACVFLENSKEGIPFVEQFGKGLNGGCAFSVRRNGWWWSSIEVLKRGHLDAAIVSGVLTSAQPTQDTQADLE